MVQLNKYLRQIGIDEKYWLFNKETKAIDDRYNPDEDGFVDAEFFSLDTSLSLYLYSQLCYFRDYCSHYSTPIGMDNKQWKSIIDKMIKSFELMIVDDSQITDYLKPNLRRQYNKSKRKKIKYGLRLFIKYYNSLWY